MIRQLNPMGMGMGIMPWSERRFCLWMMIRVGIGLRQRVVLFSFNVASLS
jgi:hypothetical protein